MRLFHSVRIWIAFHLEWLRPYLLSEKELEKFYLLEIRSSALFFGYDVSHLSDDELKKGASLVAQEIAKTGISASEANDAFMAFSQVVRNNRITFSH